MIRTMLIAAGVWGVVVGGCGAGGAARAEREQAELPLVPVTADNTVLKGPCRVAIAPGLVIADADGNGVIQIEFDDGEVVFEPGAVLRGAAASDGNSPTSPALPDSFAGTGIRIAGHKNVTIRGARIEGYKVGLHATEASGLMLEGCRFEDLWRQRLKSTPQAEDSGDWLWPHENDGQEWRKNYGAGACVEQSENVTVRGCVARRGQNGLIIDRVSGAKISDNDFSFLSGWGLAMWRSCDNVISRNAFDFCVRGYSHGVYNRGQDSAGILCFEQCSRNHLIENSVTHGGDGFFGFAGKEALGEKPPAGAGAGFDYQFRGCNENVFAGNELSYAAAHGLELTFSFRNRMSGNRFVENAICGIWGGYSSHTTIDGDNVFLRNGQGAYGLERGGVNIEHGTQNVINGRFEGNACGVHLWGTENAGLAKLPWAKANGVESTSNFIGGSFKGEEVAIHLRACTHTFMDGATFEDCRENVRADAGSAPTALEGKREADAPGEGPAPIGQSHPVGAREGLAGRQNIIMTEWGPWDHESPLVLVGADEGYRVRYDLFRLPDGDIEIEVESGLPDVQAKAQATDENDPRTLILFAMSEVPGVHPYRLSVKGGEGAFSRTLSGTLINCRWDVHFFASETDPREKLDAWRAEAKAAEKGVSVELNQLKLGFGMKGPSDLKTGDVEIDAKLREAKLPRDHFGTVARTVIPLPAGTWRIKTLSDDGVRVTIRSGGVGVEERKPTAVIENWTHHGPTRDAGTFKLDGELTPVEIEVEHFELDGFSVLELGIEKVE